jgi:hypothetical protein
MQWLLQFTTPQMIVATVNILGISSGSCGFHKGRVCNSTRTLGGWDPKFESSVRVPSCSRSFRGGLKRLSAAGTETDSFAPSWTLPVEISDGLTVTSEVAGSSPVVPATLFQRFPSLFKYLPRCATIRLATPCDINRQEMPPILRSNCSSYCST